jgi:hypothetical protein
MGVIGSGALHIKNEHATRTYGWAVRSEALAQHTSTKSTTYTRGMAHYLPLSDMNKYYTSPCPTWK